VFIDNSSTAMMLAQRLNFRRKTVMTNGITVAEQLAKENETTVLLLGGRYNYHSGSLTGYQSVKEIEQMHFHLTLCSCTSVNAGGAYDIPSGDLFIANEAGAELVGNIGGKTSVANNQQIIEGISNGVRDANAEQNALLRQQNDLLRELLHKELVAKVSPSAALGAVVNRSQKMYAQTAGV
jgi:hypothetical protein